MNNYTFFGKTISGPYTIPSGIVMTEPSVIEHIAHTVQQIGILTTKSISVEARAGYREPVFARLDEAPDSFTNAVGLTNPGADAFAQKLEKISLPKDKFLLISIFGASAQDYVDTAKKLLKYADGFELNISCPHAKGLGQAIGSDIPLVIDIIKGVKALGKPVMVKVSPNLDAEKTIDACLAGGADGITAINAWGPRPQQFDGHPVLTNKIGGASGMIVREKGIEYVKIIRQKTDKPIIGTGGISSIEDVKRYKAAGANYFGIGSALYAMDTPTIQKYFAALEIDEKENTNTAINHIVPNTSFTYHKTSIINIEHIDDTMALITLKDDVVCKGGQFVFLWIPGVGEKPFSLIDTNPTKVYIKIKGCFTKAVSDMKVGDPIYYRGPYGKPVDNKETMLVVGAGTGIAALYLIAKENKNAVALLGAKTTNQIIYKKEFETICNAVYIATSKEVGNTYLHVTDGLEEIILKHKPTYCINCGPEQMVTDCIEIEKKYIPEDHILSSIEYMTKCGVGICGACATSKGERNCVDGTFFPPNKI